MNFQFKSFCGRCLPAICSLLAVTMLGLLFTGFVHQFIDYALSMLSQATSATVHHLHITSLH